jgi:hypothetical protein
MRQNWLITDTGNGKTFFPDCLQPYLCGHKKNTMKKVFLGLAVMTIVSFSNAQTNKGDWMVGGNLRLNTAENNTQISFTPNAGVFVVDNLAIGGNFGLSYSKSGNNKFTSFNIGPFARYYFTTETQTIRPLLHATFNYLSTKSKISNTASSTNTGLNFFIGGGAAAFITENVSIDALLGYDRTKYKNFDGSGGFAFNIGFQVYLLKGQVDKVKGKK